MHHSFKFLILAALFFLVFVTCKKEDPVQPPVVSPDPVQYESPFTDIPAISDIVMYEINQRAFSASGTLNGILPRLDSIRGLGVNVIWLMPIHPIGAIKTVNSPYCIKNFTEVNPEYGNLEDLRTLVREAHKRKMAVIIDWVANHTSWDNPWIQNTTWYTQDASGNIIHPAGTNWQDVADLNFANTKMRLEMIKSMKFWALTANIDGFRCDAADYVPFDFWKQAIDSLNQIPNRQIIMLAEGARADHFTAGFHMNFSWEFFAKNKAVFKSNQAASGLFTSHQAEYATIPASAHKLRFTSNHDECAWDDTPLGLFGGKNGSMAAFVISAYMGGVPLIYNGQEVGCPVKLPFFSRSPIDWTTNQDMTAAYQNLMRIRSQHPALRGGSLESYPDQHIVAFKRKSANDEVLVFVNTRNNASTLSVPSILQNTTWKNALTNAPITLGAQLSMSSYQYLMLEK